MVVLTDSQPGSPTKTDQTWPQSQSQAGSSHARPSSPRSPQVVGVVRSPGFQQQPPPYVPGPGAPLLPGPPQKPRPTVAKRFFSALAIAVIIMVGLNIIGNIVGFIVRHTNSYEWDNNPRAEDGKILTCDTHWSNIDSSDDSSDLIAQSRFPSYPVYSVTESFDLPIDAPLHYLIARGSMLGGAAIIRGVEGADPNIAKVNVTIRYSNRDALSRANVCKLQKSEGAVGVGIYTPRIAWGNEHQYQLYVVVTVALPVSRDSLLNINGFETNLPNFRHKFERLGDRVQFEHLSVQGTNAIIQADSLYVSQGMLKTTNGHINGQYNSTDSLVLKTSNGAVDVDVGLTNDDTHKASSLNIGSSNGRVESRISLLTTHNQRPEPKGGHFSVDIKTSNGKLDVKFPTSPLNSILDFQSHTSNAIADVSLHSTFEGSFWLKTSNSKAEVDMGRVSDPAGRGRHREINFDQKGNTESKGKLLWANYGGGGGSRSEFGRADVRTSNGPVTLRLH